MTYGEAVMAVLWDGILRHDWQRIRVFCSMLFTVSSTGGFYRKPYSTLVYNSMQKKFPNEGNSSLFMNSFLQNRKMKEENKTKTRVWEDSRLCLETLNKTAVQESHLRGHRGLPVIEMVGGLDILGNLDPVVHRHVARVYREPTIVPFLTW